MVNGLEGSKGCHGQSWKGSRSSWLRLPPMLSMVTVSVGYEYVRAGQTACFLAVLGFRASFGVSYVWGICWGLICWFYILERTR